MPYVEYDEVEAVCSDCGRVFRSEEALAAHRAEAHAGHEPDIGRPAGKGVACSLCGRRFPSALALRAHNAKAHTS